MPPNVLADFPVQELCLALPFVWLESASPLWGVGFASRGIVVLRKSGVCTEVEFPINPIAAAGIRYIFKIVIFELKIT